MFGGLGCLLLFKLSVLITGLPKVVGITINKKMEEGNQLLCQNKTSQEKIEKKKLFCHFYFSFLRGRLRKSKRPNRVIWYRNHTTKNYFFVQKQLKLTIFLWIYKLTFI